MRLTSAITVLFTLALGLSSCGDAKQTDPKGTGGKAPSSQPEAVVVAGNIMRCIQEGDAEGMKALLNENNKRMSLDDVKKALVEMKQQLGSVTSVSEVRKSANRYPDGTALAKFKVEGDETFVLVLTPDKETFKFEDINSPSTADFDKLEKIWP